MKKSLLIFLLVTISANCFGYYNPSQGRWLSRDPIEELGFKLSVSSPLTEQEKMLANVRLAMDALKQRTPELAQLLKNRLLRQGIDLNNGQVPIRCYTFAENSPIIKVDPFGLQCMLNCIPFYGWDTSRGGWSIVYYCYPIDDRSCPKCPCSNPLNFPPSDHWWQYNDPPGRGLGWFYPDFDPCGVGNNIA